MKECSICQEEITAIAPSSLTTLLCGHVFHDSCIKPWFGRLQKETCPNCRVPISEDMKWKHADRVPPRRIAMQMGLTSVGLLISHLTYAEFAIKDDFDVVPLWKELWIEENDVFLRQYEPTPETALIRKVSNPLEPMQTLEGRADTHSRGWKMMRALISCDGSPRWIRVTESINHRPVVQVLYNPRGHADTIYVVKDVFEVGANIDHHEIRNVNGLLGFTTPIFGR